MIIEAVNDPLLTRAEAAQELRVSISWLERAALNGTGPPFSRLARGKSRGRVVYRKSDLLKFIDDCRRTSTSDPGANT